jgi:hypothetical protein
MKKSGSLLQTLWCVATVTALINCFGVLHAAVRFESAALVDSFDFANVKSNGKFHYDTETAEGNTAILDHVLLTGATTILWRNCGGATMRYQSQEERYPLVEAPLDKRRLPDNRSVYGWLRFYQAEPDILKHTFDLCHKRGINAVCTGLLKRRTGAAGHSEHGILSIRNSGLKR